MGRCSVLSAQHQFEGIGQSNTLLTSVTQWLLRQTLRQTYQQVSS